jgi:hypothetical protein
MNNLPIQTLLKTFILSVVVIFVVYSRVDALGINLLSQSHHIWGWAGQNDDPGETYDFYDLSDSHSISAKAEGYYYDYSPDLEYSISSASAGDYLISVKGGRWAAWASGESTYTFTSDFNQLSLSAFGHSDNTCMCDTVKLYLYDLTAGTMAFSYIFQSYWPDPWEDPNQQRPVYDFEINKNIAIIPSNIYQLYMFAEAGTGDSPASSSIVCSVFSKNSSVPASPVPEPSAILPFCVGILAFCFSNRKNKLTSRHFRGIK